MECELYNELKGLYTSTLILDWVNTTKNKLKTQSLRDAQYDNISSRIKNVLEKTITREILYNPHFNVGLKHHYIDILIKLLLHPSINIFKEYCVFTLKTDWTIIKLSYYGFSPWVHLSDKVVKFIVSKISPDNYDEAGFALQVIRKQQQDDIDITNRYMNAGLLAKISGLLENPMIFNLENSRHGILEVVRYVSESTISHKYELMFSGVCRQLIELYCNTSNLHPAFYSIHMSITKSLLAVYLSAPELREAIIECIRPLTLSPIVNVSNSARLLIEHLERQEYMKLNGIKEYWATSWNQDPE